MAKPKLKRSISSFPFDRRILGTVKLPSFDKAFPNADDSSIQELFNQYGIADKHIGLFKECIVFCTVSREPRFKRKRAKSVAKAVNNLLAKYDDQETLEILYEDVANPGEAGIEHDKIVDALNGLKTVSQNVLTRYRRAPSPKKSAHGHLVRGAQMFLYEVGLPYKKRSVSRKNQFSSTEFAQVAVRAITGLAEDELKYDAADHAIRQGKTSIDELDHLRSDQSKEDDEKGL